MKRTFPITITAFVGLSCSSPSPSRSDDGNAGTLATSDPSTGTTLSAENRRQLWIPPGYAHGFLAVSEHADVSYKVTAEYARESERAVRWDDPDLAIAWPLDGTPLVSPKDARAPLLRDLLRTA